jgi:hypothetical protein
MMRTAKRTPARPRSVYPVWRAIVFYLEANISFRFHGETGRGGNRGLRIRFTVAIDAPGSKRARRKIDSTHSFGDSSLEVSVALSAISLERTASKENTRNDEDHKCTQDILTEHSTEVVELSLERCQERSLRKGVKTDVFFKTSEH